MKLVCEVLLLLTITLSLQGVRSEKLNCTRSDLQPACVCTTSKGTVDLTPLSSDIGPKFVNFTGPGVVDKVYSYNPCNKFTEGDCTNAYICEAEKGDSQAHTIADTAENIASDDDGNFQVTYKNSNNELGGVEVTLICDQSRGVKDSEMVAHPSTLFGYKFELHSCQVCLGGCRKTAAAIAGIVGLVIMALFILAVILYFSIGAVVMKYRYGATGSDIVPNKSFWVMLPFLVKDGCLFVVSPCYKNKDGYSNL